MKIGSRNRFHWTWEDPSVIYMTICLFNFSLVSLFKAITRVQIPLGTPAIPILREVLESDKPATSKSPAHLLTVRRQRKLPKGKGGETGPLVGTWTTPYADFVRRVGFPMMRARRQCVSRFRLVARCGKKTIARDFFLVPWYQMRKFVRLRQADSQNSCR